MSSDKVPTDAELNILKILWDQGALTVRDIQQQHPDEPGYTTVLKLLQIMHEKALVDREKAGRAHRYWAVLDKEEIQKNMLERFTDRLFDGSIRQLLQQAVRSEQLGQGEKKELQQLLKTLKSE